MSERGTKLLLPIGKYSAIIVDLEQGETRTTGSPFIKIHVKIKGHHLVIYQVCAPLLCDMVIRSKAHYIGQKVKVDVKHEMFADTMFHKVVALEGVV